MKIRIENPKPVIGQKGRSYFSFWVRVFDEYFSGSFTGWKYFPDTKTISTPSQLKGQVKSGARRFVNTAKLNPAFYNEVLAQAQAYFDGETITTPQIEPEEVEA